MNINKFVYELKRLNRDTEIRRGIARCDTLADSRIFASNPVSHLVLPRGCALQGNYIVSKYGDFELYVDGMANVIAGHAYPDYGYVEIGADASYEEIAIAMQKINPDAEIRILNPELDVPYYKFISSNVDISELALPEGYFYEEEVNITDGNNKSIKYIQSVENLIGDDSQAIRFIKEDKMDEVIEILPRYDFKKEIDEQYDRDLYRMYPQLDPNYQPVKKQSKLIQKVKARFHK